MKLSIKLYLLSLALLSFNIINAQQLATKLKEVNSHGIPKETSGLCIINSTLFSINDSGNPSEIWSTNIDSVYAGTSVWRPFKISAKNIDWEAIETDELKSHIYIGDFGNNKGKRQDLKVIKIPINGNIIQKDSLINIEFSYEDYSLEKIEKCISVKGRKMHNFDCEAFWIADSSIYLFTKNWENRECNVYQIPNIGGKHIAKKVGQFDPGMLITDCVKVDETLYYCGYTITGNQFIGSVKWGSWENCTRKKLNIRPAQFEGITWDEIRQDFILSSESRKSQKESLFIRN